MGGATNEVRRRDLATGKTDVWLYRPGTNIGVVATANGKPIVSMYDGATSSYWIMSAPNQAQRMDFHSRPRATRTCAASAVTQTGCGWAATTASTCGRSGRAAC